MMYTLNLSVEKIKTYIAVDADKGAGTRIWICLNYLEDAFGWTALRKSAGDVYTVLCQNGMRSHCKMETHVTYWHEFDRDVPKIWVDLDAFSWLVEHCDTPEVFMAFGQYVWSNQEELFHDCTEGMYNYNTGEAYV